MQITIVGSGYVGLVTGACFSQFGYRVTNLDCDEKKISNLNKGIIPIYEPGLESLIHQEKKCGWLSFSTSFETSIKNSNIVIIAVGTPEDEKEGQADLTYVYDAVKTIAKFLTPYTVVVTKSTVPVGVSRKIATLIQTIRPDLLKGEDFDVASNPEFLREGSAINDFLRPDRVVVGIESEKAKEVLAKLYRPLYLIETPILFTSLETSELIKYASNAFLAIKISFINQMADLCEKVGANIQDLGKGIGLDGRIGRKFLNAGPGYGGSCFPKDTKALSYMGDDHKVSLSLVKASIDFNEARKKQMAERVLSALAERGLLKEAKVAILGITFKPNTDDLRDAPSLIIIKELLRAGMVVSIYDPLYFDGSENKQLLNFLEGEVLWAKNAYDAMNNADCAVLLTEWNEFRALDLQKIAELLKSSEKFKPLFMDLRNIYKEKEMAAFDYRSLGRNQQS